MDRVTNLRVEKVRIIFLSLTILLLIINNLGIMSAATPTSPDILAIASNTTKTGSSLKMVNISGGYVAVMNITGTIQNTRKHCNSLFGKN